MRCYDRKRKPKHFPKIRYKKLAIKIPFYEFDVMIGDKSMKAGIIRLSDVVKG